MIAQGAHASLGAVLPYVGGGRDYDAPPGGEYLRRCAKVSGWLAGPFAKICVRVRSEEELLAVYEAAKDAGLITCLVTDSGRTEFHGVPTLTCCAIGPDTDENLSPVTGDLRPGGRLELL